MTLLGCHFDFHDVIYDISLVTLTIDGVTPVLHLRPFFGRNDQLIDFLVICQLINHHL